MADEAYEVRWSRRSGVHLTLIGLSMVGLAVLFAYQGNPVGMVVELALGVPLGVIGVWRALFEPYRVLLLEPGVTLVAWAARTDIAWSDLAGVVLRPNRSGGRLVWEFSSAPLGRLSDGRRLVITMANDITGRKQVEEDRDRFFTVSLDMLCVAGFDG